MASESIGERAKRVLDAAEKAKKLFDVLLRTFAVSIFVAIASVAGLAWRTEHNHKDIEYVRSNALNKEAFFNEMKARDNYNKSVTRLLDEQHQPVVDEFNSRMDEIRDAIMVTQTEIVPRGAEIPNSKKLSK